MQEKDQVLCATITVNLIFVLWLIGVIKSIVIGESMRIGRATEKWNNPTTTGSYVFVANKTMTSMRTEHHGTLFFWKCFAVVLINTRLWTAQSSFQCHEFTVVEALPDLQIYNNTDARICITKSLRGGDLRVMEVPKDAPHWGPLLSGSNCT